MPRMVQSNGEAKVAISKSDFKWERELEKPYRITQNLFLNEHGVQLTPKQCSDVVMHCLKQAPERFIVNLLEKKW